MSKPNKGARICETVKAIKQNEELKKLAERREKFQKKVREKVMYGYECPECGATLDPGEKCDCIKREEACTGGAEQTSDAVNIQLNLHPNYTTLKGGVSSA